MDILIFIFILSLLVVIHELGHFLTAKKAGIKVEEFGLGYPPTAITLYTDKSGTAYTLNWLPFGGFVRLYGEDGGEGGDNTQAFFTKPVWQRLGVVLAGAFVNFVFGVVAFGAIYTYVGIPTPFHAVEVAEVVPGSPADSAGLRVGDRIVEAKIGDVVVKTDTGSAYISFLGEHVGETIGLGLSDGRAVSVYVRTKEEIPEGQGATGIRVQDFELKRYPVWEMPFRGMWVGLRAALDFGGLILRTLGTMVVDLVTHGIVPKEMAGPVGIAYMAQKEGVLSSGWMARINFAAILSINLAIMNVLPLPALDGGRAVFLLFEAVFRKRVRPEFEQKVNTVGFLLLIGLIVLISVKDVGRVFSDTAVQGFFLKLWPFK